MPPHEIMWGVDLSELVRFVFQNYLSGSDPLSFDSSIFLARTAVGILSPKVSKVRKVPTALILKV